MDDQGRVVTDDGYVVQSDGGAIAIQQQDSDIQVGPDGTVSIRNQVGASVQLLGKMRVVTFADERTLKKAGTSLFDAADQPATPATAETRVHQGVVEKSNVEPVVEITKMIDVLARLSGDHGNDQAKRRNVQTGDRTSSAPSRKAKGADPCEH